MPNISSKGMKMPASPIRKLVPYAEAAKRKGTKVYHLNIGQPDIETPKEAIEAIQNNMPKVVEYSHSAGIESYRRGWISYYNSYGIDLNLDDVIVTTGGSEALQIAFNACFDAGDELIIPEPFYANYNSFAIAAGVNVKPITASIDNGFALPAIEAFEKLITPKTKGIAICNPGNPTGYLYSKEELNQLMELVKKHDLFLFSDEVYREFCYDGAEPFSALKLAGIENNVIVIDSVSKRYSMCGARIGVIVSRNQELMSTALKFAQARLSPPTFGQIAGEGAIKTPQSYFDKVTSEYIERRNILVEGLNKIEGVFCPKPKGAFYAMASLPVEDAEDFCQWMLEHFEFEGATVMMAPAAGFYATPGKGKNEVRIAYVLKKDDLIHAIKCLEEGLKKYNK